MKQKRQITILIVLVVVAAGIWWSYFREKPVVTAAVNIAAQQMGDIQVESPSLRTWEIDLARKAEYKNATGRNIFSVVAATAPAVARVQAPRVPTIQNIGPQPPAPIPPPVVQPLPVKFFGFQTVPGKRTRLAFFTNGEDVFVVPEGELLMNRFRILRIGNANLDYEDPAGIHGQAPLEEQAGVGVPGAPGPGGPA